MHNAFLPNVKQFGYTIGIQFNKTPLVIDKNNYTSKLGKVYIFYHLNHWPRNLFNNLALKNCLVGATNIVKNSDKSKHVYSGYGIAFDGADLWSFGNDFARIVVIFGIDN